MEKTSQRGEDTNKRGGPPQPSGLQGDNPATAGKVETKVLSGTPENAEHRINPSAPNDGITPPTKAAEKGQL
jgi:hypothetical protein